MEDHDSIDDKNGGSSPPETEEKTRNTEENLVSPSASLAIALRKRYRDSLSPPLPGESRLRARISSQNLCTSEQSFLELLLSINQYKSNCRKRAATIVQSQSSFEMPLL